MNKRNRIICISECVNYIVKHFIYLLVSVIVCSVLSVLLLLLSNKLISNHDSLVSIDSSAHAEEVYNSLSYNERIFADVAINDYEDYYQSFELLNNSIIEKVDSYNARQSTFVYSINYDNNADVTDEMKISIINRYSLMLYNYINYGNLATDISSLTEIDPTLIQDCIRVNGYFSDSGIISVLLYGTDVEESIENAFVSSIDNYITSIISDPGLSINLIDNNTTCIRTAWIFEAQKSWEAEQTKIKTRLDTAVTGLSPNAHSYFDLVASAKHPDFYNYVYPQSRSNTVTNVSAKTIVKYGVIGALLGTIGYGLYTLFLFMYSTKIISNLDYTETMGLRLLGDISASGDINMVATKILSTCNRQEIKEISLITTNESNTNSVINDLSDILTSNGLKVIHITGFFADYKKMGKLLDNGNCVIIEKKGSSIFTKVYDEVSFCNENSVNIIGLVNIEK